MLMLQEQRHELILQELKETKSVRIANLCEKLQVTRETIRRDLHELESKGLLHKVHGGAVLPKMNIEPTYTERSGLNLYEKRLIAQKAAEMVEDGDAIYIDIGTTTLFMAESLQDKKDVTVVTNSLLVALELSKKEGFKVIISGGEVRKGELSISGSVARESLKNFYIDKAFIGIGGLTIETGVTDYHIDESDVRQLMIKHANRTFGIVDFSKFGVTAFTKVCDVQDFDVLITDDKAPASMILQLRELGVEVEIIKT